VSAADKAQINSYLAISQQTLVREFNLKMSILKQRTTCNSYNLKELTDGFILKYFPESAG
jgi:hypothetical protein